MTRTRRSSLVSMNALGSITTAIIALLLAASASASFEPSRSRSRVAVSNGTGGDVLSMEEDPDRNGVAVENNLRLLGPTRSAGQHAGAREDVEALSYGAIFHVLGAKALASCGLSSGVSFDGGACSEPASVGTTLSVPVNVPPASIAFRCRVADPSSVS